MTAVQLLEYQLQRDYTMLERLLEDFDDKELDLKLVDSSYSLRESLIHLSEACAATIKMGNGESHDWGSYSSKATDLANLKAEFFTLRSAACKAVLVENDDLLHAGANFLIGHENYHIGQLSTLKQKLHPNWTSFELYS